MLKLIIFVISIMISQPVLACACTTQYATSAFLSGDLTADTEQTFYQNDSTWDISRGAFPLAIEEAMNKFLTHSNETVLRQIHADKHYLADFVIETTPKLLTTINKVELVSPWLNKWWYKIYYVAKATHNELTLDIYDEHLQIAKPVVITMDGVLLHPYMSCNCQGE